METVESIYKDSVEIKSFCRDREREAYSQNSIWPTKTEHVAHIDRDMVGRATGNDQ